MNLSPISGDRHVITVSFAQHVVKLSFAAFDTEIDMDQYTSIDYSNIYAELITISPLMNRVGMWKADAENEYSNWKLECNVYEAKLGEMKLKELATVTESSGNVRYPSDERLKRVISLDEGVQLRKKKLYRLYKEFQYMESFYWSLKEKAGKLNKISESMNLSPVEFEQNIVEGSINGYIIKKQKR